MLQIKVVSTSKQGEFVNFRAILLTRCQREFENDKDLGKKMQKRRKIIAETKVCFILNLLQKRIFLILYQNIYINVYSLKQYKLYFLEFYFAAENC